jgi:hypothetical protein
MTLDNDHTKFLAAVESYKVDYASFQGGTKAAASRARKQLSELTKLAKTIRAEISDKKNKMSKKKGGKKKKSTKKKSVK